MAILFGVGKISNILLGMPDIPELLWLSVATGPKKK